MYGLWRMKRDLELKVRKIKVKQNNDWKVTDLLYLRSHTTVFMKNCRVKCNEITWIKQNFEEKLSKPIKKKSKSDCGER